MGLLTKILNSLAPSAPNIPTGIQPENKYAAGAPLYFPELLSSEKGLQRYPHFMKFSIYEFVPFKAPDEETTLTEVAESVKGNRSISGAPIKTIYLHVPDNLTQTLSHDWSTESISTALARYGLIAGGIEGIVNMVKGGQFDFENAAGLAEIAGTIAETVGGAGKGTKEILTAFASNRTLNPRYEAIFTGTKLREFTFDFKLAPKNPKEASDILNIIKAFKYYSAPKGTSIDRFLEPPNPFKVEFHFAKLEGGSGGDQLNNALFKIDTCVLQGVDVNYTTAGQFATFNDGMPVEIAMQLRFVEIQALTKDQIAAGF